MLLDKEIGDLTIICYEVDENKSYRVKYEKHKPGSFCYYGCWWIHTAVRPCGLYAAKVYAEEMKNLSMSIRKYYELIKPMELLTEGECLLFSG